MSRIIDVGSGEFLHLGLGATAVPQPVHTGDMSWYEAYGARTADDGREGRLVSLHTFASSWDSWEMHPNGDEVVLCVSGRISLTQEHPDGTVETAELGPGQAVVNGPGDWHTADVPDPDDPPTVLFITAGLGTEIRPRD